MVSIIIVNWNAGSQLRECVDSVIQHGGPLAGQIVVVDNGSNDGSEAAVEGLPGVTLIRAGMNLGFAKACNLGAARAQGDLLLFLNPDTRLFPDTLMKVTDYMQRPGNAMVGICGIRLVDERGNISTSAARFPTLRVFAGKILGLTKVFPTAFPAHLMNPSELLEDRPVDQVIGAFFLIRKSVFDFCDGFDERFFVYFEEVDLALRAHKHGYSSYFLSGVSAFHKGGGCSEAVKSDRLFYSLRSRILYAQKHLSRRDLFVLIFLTGLEFPLRLAQSLMRASWLDLSSTCGAYIQLVFYFARRV